MHSFLKKNLTVTQFDGRRQEIKTGETSAPHQRRRGGIFLWSRHSIVALVQFNHIFNSSTCRSASYYSLPPHIYHTRSSARVYTMLTA